MLQLPFHSLDVFVGKLLVEELFDQGVAAKCFDQWGSHDFDKSRQGQQLWPV